jgi:hypothetical protein
MQKGNPLFWKFKTRISSWFPKRFDRFKCSSEPTLHFDWLFVLYILRIRRTAAEQVFQVAKLKVGLNNCWKDMSDSLSEVKVVCKISCFSGDGDLLVLW